MKCIIVDDEKPARELLEEYVSKTEGLDSLGSFRNAMGAHGLLQKEKVDLLFLDIQMPELTGLELLRILSRAPLTVITTAYKQYALESFEYNVIDYLVKPISLDRFLKAVQKAKDYQSYLQLEKNNPERNFIFVKTSQKIIKLSTDEILYLEGYREYIKIHTTQTFYLILMTFKEAAELLPPPQFFRIHRSYIVNLNKIEYINGNLIHLSGKDLKISGTYRQTLISYLEDRNLLR